MNGSGFNSLQSGLLLSHIILEQCCVLQMSLVVCFQFSGDIWYLIEMEGFGFASVLSMVFAGQVYLRYKEPKLHRPIKVDNFVLVFTVCMCWISCKARSVVLVFVYLYVCEMSVCLYIHNNRSLPLCCAWCLLEMQALVLVITECARWRICMMDLKVFVYLYLSVHLSFHRMLVCLYFYIKKQNTQTQ